MKNRRRSVFNASETGYSFLDQEGNYWSRIFMDEFDAEDLLFPLMLGPVARMYEEF